MKRPQRTRDPQGIHDQPAVQQSLGTPPQELKPSRSILGQAFTEPFAALTCHQHRALLAFYISTTVRASELLCVRPGPTEPKSW
jgi:hypothetical protein